MKFIAFNAADDAFFFNNYSSGLSLYYFVSNYNYPFDGCYKKLRC